MLAAAIPRLGSRSVEHHVMEKNDLHVVTGAFGTLSPVGVGALG